MIKGRLPTWDTFFRNNYITKISCIPKNNLFPVELQKNNFGPKNPIWPPKIQDGRHFLAPKEKFAGNSMALLFKVEHSLKVQILCLQPYSAMTERHFPIFSSN